MCIYIQLIQQIRHWSQLHTINMVTSVLGEHILLKAAEHAVHSHGKSLNSILTISKSVFNFFTLNSRLYMHLFNEANPPQNTELRTLGSTTIFRSQMHQMPISNGILIFSSSKL